MLQNKIYFRKDSIPNSKHCFSTQKNRHLKQQSLQDIKKSLISTFSMSPETIIKSTKHKPRDFKDYIRTVESSMTKYQLMFGNKPNEKKNENEKYIKKSDKLLVKKIYNLNKTLTTNELSSRNEDSNFRISIIQKEFPNPYQSLGIIKHNYHIFNQISKNFLTRQSNLFSEQINNFQKNQNIFNKKMPMLHISGATSFSKQHFEIPVVDLTEDKDKKIDDDIALLPYLGNGLRLFAYYRYPNKNFPEGKEQFSIFTKDKDIIITGGLSAYMKNFSVWNLNLEKLEWQNIKLKHNSNNRFGHTAVIFQNKLYIFGGRTKFGNGFVSPDLEIISLIDGEFCEMEPEGTLTPEPRKNHICELVNNQMLIYGGISEKNEILNDCYYLNLSTPFQWFQCSISYNNPLPKLYGHTSSLVLPKEFYYSYLKLSIYTYPEIEYVNSRLKEIGIYIFGGKSKDENGLSNKLFVIKLGQKPLKWNIIDAKGKPPSPRYFHSMNYYEKGNILIIHGGRNDTISETNALSDTYIFDLENQEYTQVELYSQLQSFKVLSRCGHQSVIYCNKLIILGGMNNNNYIGSLLFIVNLDFNYSYNHKSAEEIMIKQLENRTDIESRKKLSRLKTELRKNQLGLVITNVDLPAIK